MSVQWFSRDGREITKGVTVKNADTGFYYDRPSCWRCGGAGGSEKWARTGWTCYRCGGSGLEASKKYNVYSAEKLAKLNATQAKAAVKRKEKKDAQEAAKRLEGKQVRRAFFKDYGALLLDAYKFRKVSPFLNDMVRNAWTYGTLSINQLDAMPRTIEKQKEWKAAREAEAARKANATYVGKVGERVEQVLRLEKRIVGGDRWNPWSLKILRNEDGCTLVTFGVCDLQEGETAKIRFTVKAHDARDGEKQTKIERLKEVKEKEKV